MRTDRHAGFCRDMQRHTGSPSKLCITCASRVRYAEAKLQKPVVCTLHAYRCIWSVNQSQTAPLDDTPAPMLATRYNPDARSSPHSRRTLALPVADTAGSCCRRRQSCGLPLRRRMAWGTWSRRACTARCASAWGRCCWRRRGPRRRGRWVCAEHNIGPNPMCIPCICCAARCASAWGRCCWRRRGPRRPGRWVCAEPDPTCIPCICFTARCASAWGRCCWRRRGLHRPGMWC